MADPIVKKVMEKRDEALREAERWEEWLKTYLELTDPATEVLDIPMTRRALPEAKAADDVELAPALRLAAESPENSNGKSFWPRSQ
jgi:hypothetical protein